MTAAITRDEPRDTTDRPRGCAGNCQDWHCVGEKTWTALYDFLTVPAVNAGSGAACMCRGGNRGARVRVSDLLERGSFKAVAGCFALSLLALALTAGPAAAARRPGHQVRHYSLADPSVIGESIVIDTATGRVLSETNADLYTHPA